MQRDRRSRWLVRVHTAVLCALAGVVLHGLATADSPGGPGRAVLPQPTAPACRSLDELSSLTDGFRSPPPAARPFAYWLWLNGYVNDAFVEEELRQFRDAGLSGLLVFDMGARGPTQAQPPAGPAFLSERWLESFARAVEAARRLGLTLQLAPVSSWDLGGSWVEPRHASKALYCAELRVEGPAEVDLSLPEPRLPQSVPRGPGGRPVFWKEVATLAVPERRTRPGHEFVFELDPPGVHTLQTVVVYQATGGSSEAAGVSLAKDISVAVSTTDARAASFRQVLRARLQPTSGPQRFELKERPAARFVRLRVLSGYDEGSDRVALGEFEVWSTEGVNVVASHAADRSRDGARLTVHASSLGQQRRWTAENIQDGATSGSSGSWASNGPPPVLVDTPADVLNLTARVQAGRLRWKVPPGRWRIYRFVCANTGERLKVPSPNSDGLATDHLSAEATRHCLRYVLSRLQARLGPLDRTPLRFLYLPSYEVRGRIWTDDFLDQFRRYRGYDATPFLPVLVGCQVGTEEQTERFLYDYRKTLSDLVVDAYYRTARKVAHEAGLLVECEAGGPGPPIHNNPVDALTALDAVDEVRGEFWPKRPKAHRLWVVKETACAAHTTGRRRVHVEAFTSMHHWQDGPFDLKPSADRAFCEGANHFVWHTSAHLPPEAGRPGWVYGAGTHLNTRLVWWLEAACFLSYLARCSFLLQQGTFVADVLYYDGDQGYHFVLPKHVDRSPGRGYDYDVVSAEVLRTRLSVRDGRLTLPGGPSYELLVLPNRPDVDPDVLRQVERLVRAGATVVGPKPQRATGLFDAARRDAEVRQLAARLWGPCDGQTVRQHRYGRGLVVWGLSVSEVLRRRGVRPDFCFRLTGAEPPKSSTKAEPALDFVHRRVGRVDVYFVRNTTTRWLDAVASFRVSGKVPELWLPESGERLPAVFHPRNGRTLVPLRLPPAGSVFVVFVPSSSTGSPAEAAGVVSVERAAAATDVDRDPVARPADDAADSERPSAGRSQAPTPTTQPLDGAQLLEQSTDGCRLLVWQAGRWTVRWTDGRTASRLVERVGRALELPGPWTVRFLDGQGAPRQTTFERLVSWTERSEPSIRYYSGRAVYERTFELPDGWLAEGRRVFVDLGALWAVGQVRVNGRNVGVAWKPPYVVDLTRWLRPGENRLEVEVANTWSNRLVGDAQLPPARRHTRTNVTHSAGVPWRSVPLRPSGLFGPVRLVPAVEVRLERPRADDAR